jgi:hypothetical protein
MDLKGPSTALWGRSVCLDTFSIWSALPTVMMKVPSLRVWTTQTELRDTLVGLVRNAAAVGVAVIEVRDESEAIVSEPAGTSGWRPCDCSESHQGLRLNTLLLSTAQIVCIGNRQRTARRH